MSVAAAALIVTIASTAVSTYSAISSSQARSEAKHEQRKMVRSQAEQARIANEQKAADYQRRAKAALATERTERGASGIGMEGSPLLTYWENAKVFEEDIQRIKQTGDIEQTALAQRGRLYGKEAKAEEEAGYLQAGQTLLTGATDVYERGHRMGKW